MGAGSSTEQRSPEPPAGSDAPGELESSGHGPAGEAPGAAADPAAADAASKVRRGHLPGEGGVQMGVLVVSARHNFPPVQPVRKLSAALRRLPGLSRAGAGLASLSWVPEGGDLALPQPSGLPLPAVLQPFSSLPVGWQPGGWMAGGGLN